MPQMNKGGKFIFGKSLIRTDGTLRIPPQAMEEYHIADEGKVYLFTGSKITGGFCVTRKGLLHPSKLGHILDDTPPLLDYSAGSGEFIKYKGRSYCWVEISQEGQILLTKKMMDFLKVRPGMELLSIRSSDIAFTMGAKGPLLEKAENYDGEIPLFKCNNSSLPGRQASKKYKNEGTAMVLYFTGTGNSRYLARRIAEGLDMPLYDLNTCIKAGIPPRCRPGRMWCWSRPPTHGVFPGWCPSGWARLR